MIRRRSSRTTPWASAIFLLAFLLIFPHSLSDGASETLLTTLNMIPLSKEAAPEFVLPMTGGRKVRLADFKGSVVFLNFWATYCAPCRSEMASIQDLQRHFNQDDLIVLAISVGEPENTIETYLSSNPFTFLILLDERKTVTRNYGVTAVPSTFLIDRQGRLVAKALGPRNWASAPALSLMRELVNALED